MIGNEKIPWKRLTVEAAAIVGSILLAFAIDAWWDERLERAEENEQLIRLRAEFNTNIERIDERLSFSRMVESSSEFFTLIEAGLNQGQPTIDVPTTTLIWFLIAPTFEADTPIFNGLI